LGKRQNVTTDEHESVGIGERGKGLPLINTDDTDLRESKSR